jgi:hypothetical protein
VCLARGAQRRLVDHRIECGRARSPGPPRLLLLEQAQQAQRVYVLRQREAPHGEAALVIVQLERAHPTVVGVAQAQAVGTGLVEHPFGQGRTASCAARQQPALGEHDLAAGKRQPLAQVDRQHGQRAFAGVQAERGSHGLCHGVFFGIGMKMLHEFRLDSRRAQPPMILPPLFSQIVVLADMPVRRLEDLADQPVGFPRLEALVACKFPYAQPMQRHVGVQVVFAGNMGGVFAQLLCGLGAVAGPGCESAASRLAPPPGLCGLRHHAGAFLWGGSGLVLRARIPPAGRHHPDELGDAHRGGESGGAKQRGHWRLRQRAQNPRPARSGLRVSKRFVHRDAKPALPQWLELESAVDALDFDREAAAFEGWLRECFRECVGRRAANCDGLVINAAQACAAVAWASVFSCGLSSSQRGRANDVGSD